MCGLTKSDLLHLHLMKKFALLSVLAALVTGGLGSSASAQTKVGTVDMKKVFESYYKTKDAEQRINEDRNAAKKELEDRTESYKKAVEEVRKLNDEIQRPELSKEGKESKSKTRDEKVTDLNVMQREIQEFQQTREKQLQERSVRMRSGIVDEIMKVVTDRVKSEQFDIVFDRSGPSLNGVPVLLYAKESYDFTPDVITALNKQKGNEPAESTAPKAAPPKAATPAASGEKPKKKP
jgi:outer membrane protein